MVSAVEVQTKAHDALVKVGVLSTFTISTEPGTYNVATGKIDGKVTKVAEGYTSPPLAYRQFYRGSSGSRVELPPTTTKDAVFMVVLSNKDISFIPKVGMPVSVPSQSGARNGTIEALTPHQLQDLVIAYELALTFG